MKDEYLETLIKSILGSDLFKCLGVCGLLPTVIFDTKFYDIVRRLSQLFIVVLCTFWVKIGHQDRMIIYLFKIHQIGKCPLEKLVFGFNHWHAARMNGSLPLLAIRKEALTQGRFVDLVFLGNNGRLMHDS